MAWHGTGRRGAAQDNGGGRVFFGFNFIRYPGVWGRRGPSSLSDDDDVEVAHLSFPSMAVFGHKTFILCCLSLEATRDSDVCFAVPSA